MRNAIASGVMVLLCAAGLVQGQPAPTMLPPPERSTNPAKSKQVNGVISYTYYTGSSPTGTPLAGPPVEPGTYTVVATFRSADGNYYTSSPTSTTFTIQKAPPHVNVRQPAVPSNDGASSESVALAHAPVATTKSSPAKVRTEVDTTGFGPLSDTQRAEYRLPQPPGESPVQPPASPPNVFFSKPALTIADTSPPPSGAPAAVDLSDADCEQITAVPIDQTPCCFAPRYWFNGEYLMWWIKSTPLPFPLVTTSNNPGADISGALGESSTAVLYGGDTESFGLFSGLRLTGGAWLDRDGCLGVEGSLFFLECNDATFGAGSNGDGRPPLYAPAFNTQLQAERALIIADPVAGVAGSVNVASTSQLWGAELAGAVNALNNNHSLWIDLLGGFRYLDLDESFEFNNTATNLNVGFVNMLRDRFATSNQFYGGVLGMRVCWASGPWYVNLTEKLAFGTTHEVVTVAGGVTQAGIGAPTPGSFPGGFFTQPSNIGQRDDNRFSVVPELQIKVGYQFNECVTAFVAYNFIYWSGVVRPGDQIDRNLNLSQSPVFGATDGVLVGAPSPRPLFSRSDFWTQGLSLGLSMSF